MQHVCRNANKPIREWSRCIKELVWRHTCQNLWRKLKEGINHACIQYLSIYNNQYFECNLGKTCTSEFCKNVQKCTSPKDECNLSVFEKLTSAYFSQIPREIILLLVKRQFFSMSRICDKKRSKPKIVLAFLSKLLCFSFIL